jgi:WD40 repeat protein/tetratricopeptide (TPR) repeat protein
VQTGLLGAAGTQVVERDRVDMVLRELTLAEVAGAEGVGERLKLGRLLNADVLVFIRDRKAVEGNDLVIELTAARADQGVRLLRHEQLWESSRSEEIAQNLLKAVDQARALSRRNDLQLFVIPPFEDRNVGLQYRSWQRAFAQLTETFITRRDGVAVIELAEADAFSREMAIGGNAVRRGLPCYLLGGYRVAGNRDEATITVDLELRRGETRLATTKLESVPVDGVSGPFERALNDVLAKTEGHTPAAADMDIEARLLTERAEVFRRIGDVDRAIPLYESALLCRPDHLLAHIGVCRSYCLMMEKGGVTAPMARRLSYSPHARMQMAELALRHLAVLVHEPGDIDLRDEFERFGRYLNLDGYDAKEDWDQTVPLYRDLVRKHDEILFQVVREGRLPEKSGLMNLSWYAFPTIVKYAAFDSGEARQRAVAWLQALESYPDKTEALQVQVDSLMKFADAPALAGDGASGLASTLMESSIPTLRFLGSVARELLSIHDEAGGRRAMAEIDKLIGGDPAYESVRVRIVSNAESRMQHTKQPTSTPAIIGELFLPGMACLNLTATTANDAPARIGGVHDWIVCRPGLELIAADGAIWRLKGRGQVERFFRMGAVRLCWDGTYVWAAGKKCLSVLTSEGQEIVRYDLSELKQMRQTEWYQCVPIGPGQVCVVGAVRLQPSGFQTWAGVVRFEASADGYVKRVEPFFEARTQRTASGDVEGIDRAFVPEWAVSLPGPPPAREPLIVVDRRTRYPLILDPIRKTARVSSHPWPYNCRAVREADAVYLSPGSSPDENPSLYRVQGVDEPPKEMFRLFDSRSIARQSIPNCYTSMTFSRGCFHLMGVMTTAKPWTFVWLAVNAATGKTSVLADPLPDTYTPWPTLRQSEAYDTILLSSTRAFGAALPSPGNWPDARERFRYELSARPAASQSDLAEAPAGQELKLFRGHTYKVACVRFAPDGRRAISSGWYIDKTLAVWDIETGKALRVLQGHNDGIYGVAFSPDGRHALSGGFKGSLRLWDVEEGREVRALCEEEGRAIGALAYSPDGRRAATGSSSGVLRMWDVESGKELYRRQIGNNGGVWGLGFSRDGRILAAGANGLPRYRVSIMNAEDGREIRRVEGLAQLITAVALSPDAKRVAASGWDSAVLVWDVDTGKLLRRLTGNVGGVYGLAFLPDGRRLVSGGGNRQDPGWMNADGSLVNEQEQEMKMGGDNSVRLWDVDSGQELARFEGHARAVRSVDVSPDGRYAISASDDHTVRLWSLTGPLPAPPGKTQQQGTQRPSLVNRIIYDRTTLVPRIAGAAVLVLGLVCSMAKRLRKRH